jgi:chromosome segregation ATPase
LKSDLARSNEKVVHYKQQFQDFQSTVREWEEKVKSSPSADVIMDYQKSIENLTKDNSILNISFADSQLQVELLNRKIEKMNDTLGEARHTKKELTEKLNLSQDENLNLIEARGSLEKEVRCMEDALKMKDEAIQKLQREARDQSIEISELKETVEELQTKLTSSKVYQSRGQGAEEVYQEHPLLLGKSLTASPLSRQTVLGLTDFEQGQFSIKPHYEYTFTSPRKQEISGLFVGLDDNDCSKPSSAMSQKATAAYAATSSFNITSEFDPSRQIVQSEQSIYEKFDIQFDHLELISLTKERECPSRALVHNLGQTTSTNSESDKEIVALKTEINDLSRQLEATKTEMTRLMEENKYCRELAIDSTLKMALLCFEHESYQVRLQHRCRAYLQLIKAIQSLAIRWKFSEFSEPPAFHSQLAGLLESHEKLKSL